MPNAPNAPRFTEEEEIELHARMVAGDREAANLLALSVLPWALKKARKYVHGKFSFEDAEEVANLAVASALRGWDPSRARLTTVVPWHVRCVYQRAATDSFGVAHIPDNVLFPDKEANRVRTDEKVQREREHCQRAMNGRHLGTPLPGYANNRERTLNDLVAQRQGADGTDVENATAYEEELAEMRFQYRWAMDRVSPPRLREILQARWEQQLTLEDVGKLFKITRERARQLELQGKTRFYEHLSNAPRPINRRNIMSTGIGPAAEAAAIFNNALGVTAGEGGNSLLSLLANKSLVDVNREIEQLDNAFAAIESKYKGQRNLLLVIQKAVKAREQTQLSPTGGTSRAKGIEGDQANGVLYAWLQMHPGAGPKDMLNATGLGLSTINYLLKTGKNTFYNNTGRGRWEVIKKA